MAFCGNCGTQYQDGARFCPKCGAPATPMATPPPMYAPPPQAPYGYPPPQPMYGGMAPQYRGGKSKTAAVLIAFFFSAWTWAYTWKRDKGKFIMTLILGAVLGVFYVIAAASQSEGLGLISIVAMYGFSGIVWLWAFFGALFRGSDWYRMYY